MKCARCGHDSKLKEREDGKCPKCRGAFAFEPRKGDPWSDLAFQRAIERASSKGTVRFLPAHVYYLLNRKAGPNPLVVVGSWIADLFYTLFGWLGLRRAPTAPRRVTWTKETFDTMWARWVQVHGSPAGLIKRRRRDPHAADPARRAALEEELQHYSFDRAVITDRPEVVDVLLANQFHFENNTAILSIGGYPEDAFTIVRAMLRNNPRLLVLCVHDASPAGCRLAERLTTDPEWFPKGARVVDVGLRPAHARFFEGAVLPVEGGATVPAGPGLTDAEAAWLERWRLEVAAMPPDQLVKRLFKAMSHAEAGGYGDGDPGWVIFGLDSGSSDGGGDSFG